MIMQSGLQAGMLHARRTRISRESAVMPTTGPQRAQMPGIQHSCLHSMSPLSQVESSPGAAFAMTCGEWGSSEPS